MILNRFIKCVSKTSDLEDNNLTSVYISKMPFFCSQEGLKRICNMGKHNSYSFCNPSGYASNVKITIRYLIVIS